MNYNKVSIITVVFNGANEIEATIKSVISQTYQNIEYIIIDGGSTDGTVDIIKKYEDQIDYWITEKDKGIYDAMHKGIKNASGIWINFMNAGDLFNNKKVINNVFKYKISNNISFIFGDMITDYGEFIKYKKAGSLDKIAYGMQFSHQSLFVKREYFNKHKFNLKNRIGADFEFLYYASKHHKKKFMYVPLVIARVTNGGLSDIKRFEVLIGCWKVVGFNNLKINLFYLQAIIKEGTKTLVKKILGRQITNNIIKAIK